MIIATRILKLRELSDTVDIAVRLFAPEQREAAWFVDTKSTGPKVARSQ